MSLILKSERQIQTEILSTLISLLGLNDINPGSVIDVLSQAIAQQDFALYYQIAQVAKLVNLDSISGDDLENKAFEYGLTRKIAAKTKGIIDILREEGFQKVSTSFFVGSPDPIEGDTQIDVNDASNVLYGSSGTLILGRGTNNEEEVTYSTPPIDNTTYWRFTLDLPLTKDHAPEETVILKQGVDQTINAGTIVVVPATGVNAEIQFSIDNDTILLAGEEVEENVEVTAVEAGTSGNIPIGAIDGEDAFTSPPFPGARARNNTKFTTGRDLETDDELRDRIKNYIQGISRAVKQAILNAIVGLVDPESAKRVVSASVVLPIVEAGAVKVYIDDGIGFEPSFISIGFETVLTSASGGEQRLQVDRFPVVKAQIESNTEEFYDMSSGPLTLIYEVGTRSETITFEPDDFRSPDIATAEEIVTIINDKATLIESRTSRIGKFVLITAKIDINESIKVVGGTANDVLNFPTDRKNTINLYIDDIKKSKDGETAILDSGNQGPYDLLAIGAFPHELNIIVDGKTANPEVAVFNASDTDDTSAVTVEEICTVLNRDLVGIIAFPVNGGTKVRIESLTKLSSDSKLEVTGGSLNDATNGLNFSTDEQVGVDGDYTFNRELGTIELAVPLVANQNVTLGSLYTRAKQRASIAELYEPLNGQTLVISVDGGSDQTVTFDASFAGGKTAQDTADFINVQLFGATAVARERGGLNYLEIRTNTYDTSGSIEIQGSSTANAVFDFTLDEVTVSAEPNKAYSVSVTGPYDFAESDTLILVLDDDIVDNTISILMNYASEVTGTNTTSIFSDSSLFNVFDTDDELNNFYVAFTSGTNTITGTITTVADQGSNIFRYTFSPVPGGFGAYATGDLANISGLDDSGNNGKFVITSVGANYIQVVNASGVNATVQTGTGILSLRRQVSNYVASTGEITVSSPFAFAPLVGDDFILIPSTVTNLVGYINNTKITSFSLKGLAEGVSSNTKLQLSSHSEGSDGSIQVTGGRANLELQFSTTFYRGIEAYSYWIGLLALVHKTIYGDDSDLETYPGYGAAGVIFRVLAPTIRQIRVELDITLREGVTISSIENDVRSAVTEYINTLGLGEDVIVERIRAAVIAIPGITDVEIADPTINIPIADNERAVVSDPDISIG